MAHVAENGCNQEWVHCRLADACSAINYGLTASATDTPTGPKFLRITDIVSGVPKWDSVPYVSAEESEQEKYQLFNGDIVVARTGASTGVSAFIKDPPQALFASYLVRLQTKPEFDPRFVSYYLKSEEFWTFIRGVLGDKSAQPNASASTMTSAPFRAPRNLSDQQAIAHVLGTLDDKIELNRRTNQTLEEMARAIYKDWFVDFGPVRAKMEGREPYLPPELWNLFPDELVDSELGEIPEGWESEPLGEIIELAYGKALKAGDRKGGLVPVYGSNGQVGWHDVKLVSGPGIIVGRKGNPGTVTWSHDDFFPIDTAFYVVPENPEPALHFLYYALTDQDLPSIAADSAVPGLNRNLAYMNKLLVPKRSLMEIYDSYVEELFIRMYQLEIESRNLTLQRNTLLPRLVSGELMLESD